MHLSLKKKTKTKSCAFSTLPFLKLVYLCHQLHILLKMFHFGPTWPPNTVIKSINLIYLYHGLWVNPICHFGPMWMLTYHHHHLLLFSLFPHSMLFSFSCISMLLLHALDFYLFVYSFCASVVFPMNESVGYDSLWCLLVHNYGLMWRVSNYFFFSIKNILHWY